jgi:L-threonylcarbamoyladenylate synthase
MQSIIEKLLREEIAIISTDTLFALSCDATSNLAVEKIYYYKEREANKKLPILFKNIAEVEKFCILQPDLVKLAEKFWPGPLTLLLEIKKNTTLAKQCYDNNNNIIAARVPGPSLMLDLLQEYQQPLVGTSANKSGGDNSLEETELSRFFNKIPIFQDNRKPSGIQSTIVGFNKITNKINIIRQGFLTIENLTAL